MNLTFHPEARDEFAAAAEFYEDAVPGLGNRFLVAVRRLADLILTHPEIGSASIAGTRRFQVHGFPYDVVYRVRNDEVELLAIAHQHRRPRYWADRLQDPNDPGGQAGPQRGT